MTSSSSKNTKKVPPAKQPAQPTKKTVGVGSTKASNTNRDTTPKPADKSKGKTKGVFAEVVDSDSEDAQSDPRKRLSPSSSNTISESAPPSDGNSSTSGDEQIANGNGTRQ